MNTEIKPEVGADGKPIVQDNGGEGDDIVLADEAKGGKYADETPAQRSARYARMSDRHDKKNGLGKYAEKPPEQKPNPSDKTTEFGYGEKAFLNSEGIKGEEEHALVKDIMKESGKTLEQVVASGYFQSQLKEVRYRAAAKAAIPDTNNRAGNQSPTSVEYWIKKGALPPNTPENRKLRQDVVNARYKQGKSDKTFTDSPLG